MRVVLEAAGLRQRQRGPPLPLVLGRGTQGEEKGEDRRNMEVRPRVEGGSSSGRRGGLGSDASCNSGAGSHADTGLLLVTGSFLLLSRLDVQHSQHLGGVTIEISISKRDRVRTVMFRARVGASTYCVQHVVDTNSRRRSVRSADAGGAGFILPKFESIHSLSSPRGLVCL